MSRVAIFGGAFDPITLGHQSVAKLVHQQTGMDVWFMPCFRHIHGKDMASFENRTNMCNDAAIILNGGKDRNFSNTWFEDSCYEGKEPHIVMSSYAVWKRLEKCYDHKSFYFIIGEDNAQQIADGKWKHSESLMKEFTFITVQRPGVNATCDWHKKWPHLYLEGGHSASSTEARELLGDQKYDLAEAFLDKHTIQYIQENGLYLQNIQEHGTTFPYAEGNKFSLPKEDS